MTDDHDVTRRRPAPDERPATEPDAAARRGSPPTSSHLISASLTWLAEARRGLDSAQRYLATGDEHLVCSGHTGPESDVLGKLHEELEDILYRLDTVRDSLAIQYPTNNNRRKR